MALNRDSRRAPPISKRQPPMEEKKATPKSKVGIRLFNEDVDWHGLVRICKHEMSSESGFFFFQVSGIHAAVSGTQDSRH